VSKICMQCDIAVSCGLEVVLVSNKHQRIEVSNFLLTEDKIHFYVFKRVL
jgi:hypothetical protein